MPADYFFASGDKPTTNDLLRGDLVFRHLLQELIPFHQSGEGGEVLYIPY
jgi:hypothetical protein